MDAITTISQSIRGLERLSPALAARAALPLFLRVGPALRVREHDAAVMDQARRWTTQVSGIHERGGQAQIYEWGTGPDVVVLAHGWQGRAAQFAPLVRELRGAGFRVVAFDAPAHGAAPGRRTYIVDWVDTIRAIQARHGALHALVGHSFGGLAALMAVAEGVQVRRIVTASAPADADALFRGFRAQLGYGADTDRVLRARFARTVFDEPDPIARVSAVAHPVGAPVLVAHDPGDRRMPHSEARRLRRALPGAQGVDIAAGHSAILRADAFLDAATAFVARSDIPVPPPHPRRPARDSSARVPATA